MSKTLRTITSVVVAAGVFITTGNIGLSAAAFSLTSSALAKKPKTASTLTNLDRLTASLVPSAPRKIVFGRTAMATDIRYVEPSGTNQEYIDYIIHLASHRCTSVDELWIEDTLAWTSAGGAQGIYTGYVTIQTILEASPAAYHVVNTGSKWGASQRLTGCCTMKLRIRRTGINSKASSPFAASGLPSNIRIVGQGMPLYDPRRDSTVPGGSGSHRIGDQSTWQYSAGGIELGQNLALQDLAYHVGWRINGVVSVGLGLSAQLLDLAAIAAAANACDEAVTLAAGGTQRRYETAGVVSDFDDPRAVTQAFADAGNGWHDDSAGKLGFFVAVNDLAGALPIFTDDDILSGGVWRPFPGTIYNIIRGRNPEPSAPALFQPTDYPDVVLPSIDGIDRAQPLDLPIVQDKRRAQRIVKQALQRLQYQGTIEFTFGVRAWQLNRGQAIKLSFATLGWSLKLFRVVSMTFNQDCTVDVVLREENAAIYAWEADERPAVQPAAPTVYDPRNNPLVLGIEEIADSSGVPGPQGPPGADGSPGAPTYTWIAYADSLDGYLHFTTGAPDGRAFIGRADNKTTGTESTNRLDYTWSPYKGPPNFGLVSNGYAYVAGNRIISTPDLAQVQGGDPNAFVGGAFSSESYTGGASVSFRADQSNGLCGFMVGLNDDPVASNGWQDINYAIHPYEGGIFGVYAFGSNYYTSPANSYSASTVFQIDYDGKSEVSFKTNGVEFFAFRGATAQAANQRLFLDATFRSPDTGATILSFTGRGKSGADGTNGVPGAPGTNGAPTYTWVAYANSYDGLIDFVTGAPGGRAYQGIASNQTAPTESTNPADYQWNSYAGPSAYGLVGQNAYIAGSTVIKNPAVGAGWGNGGAYADTGFSSGAFASFQFFGDAELMAGLNDDPAASAEYNDILASFYVTPGGVYWDCRINGNTIPSLTGGSNWSGEWTWVIQYDGTTGYIYWFVNGGQQASYYVGPGLTLWLDSAIQTAGGRYKVRGYGPAAKSGLTGSPGAPGTAGSPGVAGSPGATGATGPTGPAGITVPPPVAVLTTGNAQLPTSVFVASGASISLVALVFVNSGGASASANASIQVSVPSTGSWTTISGGTDSQAIPAGEGTSLNPSGTFANTGAAGLFDFRVAVAVPFGGRTIDGRYSYLRVTG